MDECIKEEMRFAVGEGEEAALITDEAKMQAGSEQQCADTDDEKNGLYKDLREEKHEEYEKAHEMIEYIRSYPKKTPVKAYIHMKSDDEGIDEKCTGNGGLRTFGCGDIIAFGEWDDIRKYIIENNETIDYFELEVRARNSAVELIDIKDINARIEPGAIIRENVQIGENAVIMMGAVINIGAVIGEGSMIDMGAVIGAGAVVGEYCHVGAGAVLAGMLEPMCKEPVTLERGVMIGANAVVLEGCRIGANAAVAAGAVVTGSLPAGTVAAGVPARIVKQADEQTRKKTAIVPELRG